MLTRQLRRGLAVTELGFGAAQLGNLYRPTSDDDARAAVDAAWDAGIRYFDAPDQVPTRCLTQGIATILDARSHVVLAFGAAKARAVHDLFRAEITSMTPAVALRMAGDVTVVVDSAAASRLAADGGQS